MKDIDKFLSNEHEEQLKKDDNEILEIIESHMS